MRAVRLFAMILALGVAIGPTLLDRCLIRCHGDESAPAMPACHHEVTAADGLSIQGTSACSHDHQSLVADTSVERRASAHRHHTPVVVQALVASPTVWSPVGAATVPRERAPVPSSGPPVIHLRV